MGERKMAKLYTVEKVLYLASQERGLNVSHTEKSSTDLSERVDLLLSKGFLQLVGEDDCSKYYKTTKEGKIKLLRLQIEFRKNSGKSIDTHELELSELLTA